MPEATVPWTNHCPFLGLSFFFWKMVENQQDDPKSLIRCGVGIGWGWGAGRSSHGCSSSGQRWKLLPQIYQVLARTCLGSGEGRGPGEMGQKW